MDGTVLRPAKLAAPAAQAAVVGDAGERITVVHIASGDLWAGAEVQLFNLACTLDVDPEIRLFVILLNPGLLAQRLQERGVSVIVFDEGRLNFAQIILRVWRFLRQVRPDVVHTHRMKENAIGALAARLVGARSMRTIHGLSEHRPGRRQWRQRAQTFADRFCADNLQDRLVAVSPELGSRLRRQYAPAKICVVENGLDTDAMRVSAGASVDLPGDLNAVKVALVARLAPVKRIDIFLDAAAILQARHPGRFEFYVFGDGPLMADARRQAAGIGLGCRVFFMGFKDPIAPYLARMDMLMITSDHEGLPMNLLEALSLEVPVVAHAVGGINGALDGGRGGTLVQRQQAEAYADAAQAYLRHRPIFLQKAKEGHALLRARYSAESNALAFKALYAELCRDGKAADVRALKESP